VDLQPFVPFIPFFATFFGVLAAFGLQGYSERREKDRHRGQFVNDIKHDLETGSIFLTRALIRAHIAEKVIGERGIRLYRRESVCAVENVEHSGIAGITVQSAEQRLGQNASVVYIYLRTTSFA